MEQKEEGKHEVIRLVLRGAEGVGKTCLSSRWGKDIFIAEHGMPDQQKNTQYGSGFYCVLCYIVVLRCVVLSYTFVVVLCWDTLFFGCVVVLSRCVVLCCC